MNARLLLVVLLVTALATLAWPTRARAIDFNLAGSAQLDYLFVPGLYGVDPRPPTNTFPGFTQELSLKLAVDITSHLSANVKVCVGCHGFELAMGYADVRVADEFNIRAGRFNPTFGEFGLRYDVANHRTSDRPLPYDMGRMLYMFQFNRSVLPLPYVETGIEVSGSHFFARRVQLDYAAHVVSGLRGPANGYDLDFTLSHGANPYTVDNNIVPSFGGRVGATFRLADRTDFTIGASGIYGAYDPDGRLDYLILGVDSYLRIGRTSIRAEYLIRRTDQGPLNRFNYPLLRNPDGSFQWPELITDGFYVEVEQPINRYLDVVLRFDGLHRRGNTSALVPAGTGLDFDAGMLRGTGGFNVIIDRSFRIKANVEYYRFWGMQNGVNDAVAFHLSAVTAF